MIMVDELQNTTPTAEIPTTNQTTTTVQTSTTTVEEVKKERVDELDVIGSAIFNAIPKLIQRLKTQFKK